MKMKRLRMTTLTVLASAMVLLTSCLGEGGSETSLYGIAGVVESQPLTTKKWSGFRMAALFIRRVWTQMLL